MKDVLVKPLRGKVLLAPEKMAAQGLIALPVDYQKNTLCFRVVAIGEPERAKKIGFIPWEFGVGDRVIIPTHAVTMVEGSPYRMVKGSDILAVLDRE